MRTALYALVQKDAFGSNSHIERSEQRKWLKSRGKDCPQDQLHKCLVDSYHFRLDELAVAALFKAPDIALATLYHEVPHQALLYEAIYKYSTIDDPNQRIKAVEKLITPAFDAIHTELTANPLLSNHFSTAHEIAASDTAFATFLDVVSTSNYISPTGLNDFTLPCEALVRRPSLIEALGSIYGGSMDGRLVESNCDTRLPKLPYFDRLIQAEESAQPECKGTISFSLGREYRKTLIAVRLHNKNLLKPNPFSESNPMNVAFIADEHRELIEQSINELSDYYVRYFDIPPTNAHLDAEDAVMVTINEANGLCE